MPPRTMFSSSGTPAPRLGEHNEVLLKELGLKKLEIKNLKAKGIVAGET